MAVNKRGYIFGAFFTGLASFFLITASIVTDNWIECITTDELLPFEGHINYGLFRGVITQNTLATPSYNTLYITCLTELSACAYSCKTNIEARREEVRALSELRVPNPACVDVTVVEANTFLSSPAAINFIFYAVILVVIFLQVIFSVIAISLAILNILRNPTEPLFSLSGCLWSNLVTAFLGVTVVLLFGVYWSLSGLKSHLAVSYIAIGVYQPIPSLGYSYWLLLISILSSLASVGLLLLRRHKLEKEPAAPKSESRTKFDNTVFLY